MITKIYNSVKWGVRGALIPLILMSCSLEENPRDQISEEEAYTTPQALYLNTVATLYNYIGDL